MVYNNVLLIRNNQQFLVLIHDYNCAWLIVMRLFVLVLSQVALLPTDSTVQLTDTLQPPASLTLPVTSPEHKIHDGIHTFPQCILRIPATSSYSQAFSNETRQRRLTSSQKLTTFGSATLSHANLQSSRSNP